MRRGDYERWLAEPGSFALVAEEDGEAVGYAVVHLQGPDETWVTGERTAELETIAVLPEQRGAGIGAALMDAVDRELGAARDRRPLGWSWWPATPTRCASTSGGVCGPTCTGCTGVGFPAMGEIALHHRRAGEGEPLVAVHGIGSTWQVWNPVLPALEERHDVLALSLPGYGESPPVAGEPTVPALVDAVEEAMDAAGLRHRAHRRQLDGRLDRRRAGRAWAGANRGRDLAGRPVHRQGAATTRAGSCDSRSPRPSASCLTPSASPRPRRGAGWRSG